MPAPRSITEAFTRMRRSTFLPVAVASSAAQDAPLPIGYGQTNSQPSTVERMLTWLDVHPGQHILDVGSGSGWTTALLAYLVGANGSVIGIERISALADFGRHNCMRHGLTNVTIFQAGTVLGWPESAPYDRILVSAATDELPLDLVDQLRPGGVMVIPIASSIVVIRKTKSGLDSKEHPGYVFVPLL